jgi:hypothetical protein
MTRRTHTLTHRQCDQIKEQDHIYVLNATNLVKNAGTATWVPAILKRLGDEAIQRWMAAHPIPKTVIAVAFDVAEERRAA